MDNNAEIDAIIREAYMTVNQDYLRRQAVEALVASGKPRKEVEEWLNQCEIVMNGD